MLSFIYYQLDIEFLKYKNRPFENLEFQKVEGLVSLIMPEERDKY